MASKKSSENSGGAEVPKKVVKRRSVFVCIPIEYEPEVVDAEDGETVTRKPSRYAIAECTSGPGQKDAIRAALTEHGIDATNFDDVLMFRASPMKFEARTQVVLKF